MDSNEVVLDAWQHVFVLTLKAPICSNSEPSSIHRVVTSPEVLAVEVVPGEGLTPADLQSRLGKVMTVRGTLSENVWWHYKAALLLTAIKID